MTAYIEDFQSYTPNAGITPTGWIKFGLVIPGQVVNNMGGGKVSAKQGYHFSPGDDEFFPIGGLGVGTSAFGSYIQGTSTFGIIDDSKGPIIASYFQSLVIGHDDNIIDAYGIAHNTRTDAIGQPLSFIEPEGDNSITLWAGSTHINGGTRMANTVTAFANQAGFQSWQVVWKYPTIINTSGTWVGVQGALWLDGTLLVTTGTVTTDIPLNALSTTSSVPTPNQAYFAGNGNIAVNSYITDLFVQSGVAVTTLSNTFGYPVYFVDAQGMIWPFSGTGGGTAGNIPPVFAANVSQLAIEVAKQHSSPILRVSQAAVETIKSNIPTMRVSQVAVEIIKRGGAAGWMVYEV